MTSQQLERIPMDMLETAFPDLAGEGRSIALRRFAMDDADVIWRMTVGIQGRVCRPTLTVQTVTG